MRGGRNALGRVLFGDFLLHEQEKVTRSSTGRVEALAFWNQDQKQRRWMTSHPAVESTAKNMRE